MDDLGCPHHVATEDLAHALHAETHTENGDAGRPLGDQHVGESGIVGCARAGADEDAVGGDPFHVVEIESVVAPDHRLGPQLAQVLDEVVDERVVVVDHEDAGHESMLAAASRRSDRDVSGAVADGTEADRGGHHLVGAVTAYPLHLWPNR